MELNFAEIDKLRREFQRESLAALDRLLEDATASDEVRIAAIQAIYDLDVPIPAKIDALLKCLQPGGVVSVFALRYATALRHPTPELLARIDSMRKNSRPDVRSKALKSLAILGDTSIVDDCERVFKEGSDADCARAICALSLISCSGAVDALTRCWHTRQSVEIRILAGAALVRKGQVWTVDWLCSQLEQSDLQFRIVIAVSLAAVGDTRGLVELRALLDPTSAVDRSLLTVVCRSFLPELEQPGDGWELRLTEWVETRLKERGGKGDIHSS